MLDEQYADLLVERSFATELVLFLMLSACIAVLGIFLVSRLRRRLRHRAARRRMQRRVAFLGASRQ